MQFTPFRILARVAAAAATASFALLATTGTQAQVQVQDYPNRVIRLVVPYAPGAGTDVAARLVAQHLGLRLKQAVVVENRAGASGNIGTEFVAKAPADGYTLLVATPGPVAVGASLYKGLRYDPMRDLAPVILLNQSPVVMLSNPKLDARTVADVVSLSKKRPDRLNASIAASGSVNHLVTELFKFEAASPFTSVPYKGGAQAVTDAVGGQVDLIFVALSSVTGQVSAGQLRPLAVASPARNPLIPNVPTMAEAGYPRVVGTAWNGISVPAGTPALIIAKLNAEIQAVLALPEVRQRFATLGMVAVGGSPEGFADFLRVESVRWAEVIRRANITEE